MKSEIYDKIPTIWWKYGENRFSISWDNLSERFISKKETTGCTSFTFVNSEVTGPTFTKFYTM